MKTGITAGIKQSMVGRVKNLLASMLGTAPVLFFFLSWKIDRGIEI
jgi:hypothetical protein